MSAKKPKSARAKISVAAFNRLIDEHLLLAAQFGMRAEKIGPGTATLRLRFHSSHIRPGGTIAGPVQMALADVALYAVVLSLLGRVELAVTTSLNINFLRRPAPVDIIAHAKILKLGKRLAVGECSLFSDGEDEMVAHVTGTYFDPAIVTEKQAAPVVGVGAVVWKGENILLIRRGQAPRKGSWSLPGGRQQLGETVNEGVAREVREETGVEISILDTVAVVDLIERDGDAITYHYTVVDVVAEWISGEARAGDDAAEVAWASAGELGPYALTPKMLEVIEKAATLRGR